MATVELKVYKFPRKDYVIIFIPQLAKVYKTDFETAAVIPSFIKTSDPTFTSPKKYSFQNCTLIVTNNCNLHCEYCYGEYGEVKNKHVMPFSLAKATIDYIFQNSKKEAVGLNFFGGEPSLAWELLVASTNYFRKKGLETGKKTVLGITTNGACASEKAGWMAEKLDKILLSIDGFKTIQDRQRSASFDLVFKNAKIIYKIAPEKLKLRATIS